MIALDPSPLMVHRCQDRGVTAYRMTLPQYAHARTAGNHSGDSSIVRPQAFEVVVAMCSLVHVPSRHFMWHIREIHRLLAFDGLLVLGMIKRDADSWPAADGLEIQSAASQGCVRFMAKYTQDELLLMLTGSAQLPEALRGGSTPKAAASPTSQPKSAAVDASPLSAGLFTVISARIVRNDARGKVYLLFAFRKNKSIGA